MAAGSNGDCDHLPSPIAASLDRGSGLPGEAVIEVPYLTGAEADEIVRVANGDAEKWGKIAYAVGAQGHPQLTHAFAMGMAAPGWPKAEMHDVIIRGFASDDTRRGTRRRASKPYVRYCQMTPVHICTG